MDGRLRAFVETEFGPQNLAHKLWRPGKEAIILSRDLKFDESATNYL